MNADLTAPVEASNALTARWVAELDTTTDCLISGFSAWHLLSILAAGATGKAREELAAATNIDAAGGPEGVNQLFDMLSADITSGVGLWIRPDLTLKQAFADLFPAMAIDTIPDDLTELDRWVSKATGGTLDKYPMRVVPSTRLTAAGAMGLDTPWQTPFKPGRMGWTDESERRFAGLSRSQSSRDNAAVISGADSKVSRYVCMTEDNIDVHLVCGDESDTGSKVLRTAVEAVAGKAPVETIETMPIGTSHGCMTIEQVPAKYDSLLVRVPAFSLDGDHDLTKHADVFGLSTSPGYGHMAAESLAIDQASQVATAEFRAVGFKAAAVTAVRTVRSRKKEHVNPSLFDSTSIDHSGCLLYIDRRT